tara:strand:+ start:5690 stop:5827 length:138 start_codon:yes stop_codon:yes gene_type:complete
MKKQKYDLAKLRAGYHDPKASSEVQKWFLKQLREADAYYKREGKK